MSQDVIESKFLPAGFDWRDPDYSAVYEARVRRIRALRAGEIDLAALKVFYAGHPVEFICDWGMTFDPRQADIGKPTTVPFVLFQRQIDYILWLVGLLSDRRDGVCEKSRDMGVTWLCVAFSVWMWLFKDGCVVGIGSRKEEYVDKIGDPKSIFWKIRAFIKLLPSELKPGSYNERTHAAYMKVINPVNGSSIVGEAGDNIGRGNRTTIYFLDEAAFLEHADAIDAAISQTSNCKIWLSTVNGAGNVFYRKRHSGKFPVFVFDWRAQPLDAKLLTPSGWRLMGDIAVGDFVISRDGRPVEVLAITSHGERAVYRVSFDDGSSTECCEDHLWSVIPGGNHRAERRHILKTMPLRDIAQDYVSTDARGFKRHAYQIPMVSPVTFDEQILPLDPYVLGCILGDGSISSKDTGPHLLTVGDAEIIEHCASRLPPGCELKHDRGIQYRFSAGVTYRGAGGRGTHSPICSAIRDLGLVGAVSHTKFIPDSYKLADAKSRLDLLCGLFDTDGNAPKSHPGSARFSSTSRRLAEDVVFVAQSLGGTAKLSTIKPQKTGAFPGGRVCVRRDIAYLVTVKLPHGMVPFKLRRKVDAFKPAIARPPRRSIVGVELVGAKEVQCITVSSSDGLYVTDDFIVTHNCDPRKGPEWYEMQKAILEPHVVAQEIDRDYTAAVTDAYISGKLVTACTLRGPADVAATGPMQVGVDCARFGDDKTVVTFRQGRLCSRQEVWGKVDIVDSAGRVRDLVDACIEPVEQIAVDTIGIGAGVADMLRRIYGDKVVDVNSGTQLDDGRNWNLRARMWRDMLEWVKGPVSIPNDPDLVSDLTSLRYSYRDSRLLIESKVDAKKRGIKSPDRADSLALTFAFPVKDKQILAGPQDPAWQVLDEIAGY